MEFAQAFRLVSVKNQLERKELPIELNEQFKHALDLMEYSDRSVFITGCAATITRRQNSTALLSAKSR